VGLKKRKILGLQDGQEPAGAMIGVQSLRHGKGSVHSTTTQMSTNRLSVTGSINGLSEYYAPHGVADTELPVRETIIIVVIEASL
jgi:hypothetical protein